MVRWSYAALLPLGAAPLGLAVACGAFDGDEAAATDGGVDATASDGSPAPDATADGGAGRCDPFAPFSTPSKVAGIADTNEVALQATLSADEKTLYFFRSKNGENIGRIVMSTRASTGEAFGPGVVVATSPDGGTYATPAVTPDALTVLLTDIRGGSSGAVTSQKIVRGTRADVAGTFGGFTTVGELDSIGAFTTHPALARGGLVLYVTSGASLASRTAWRGSRPTLDAPFSGFVELAVGNPGEEIATPVPSDDDEVLYFSTRAPSSTKYTMYVTRRTSPGGAFGTARPVTELQVADQVFPAWLSSDRCRLYFTGGTAYPDHAMYIATRKP